MTRIRRLPTALLGDDRGKAFVEFGLAAPILLVLTLGIIDMGRALWMSTSLGNAAREGARYASIHGAESLDPLTDAEIIAYVEDRATGFADRVAVTVTWNPNNSRGSTVTIDVTSEFDFLLTGFLDLGGIDIAGSSSRTVL